MLGALPLKPTEVVRFGDYGIADAFPVLNALKDVHPMRAEGARNQFGDMAWTARSEMLVQQWIIGRPEFREFLGAGDGPLP